MEWFHSYLENRYQHVNYNGTFSTQNIVKCGVPQGLVLHPLLFILYVNDIELILTHSKSILFAVDTTIHISGKNISKIKSEIEYDLEILGHWFKANKLSFSVTKTNFMYFNYRKC